jgi:hypothetical protein
MLQIIRTNETDEFLAYFPDHVGLYKHTKNKFDSLVSRVQHLVDNLQKIPV